jgi:hypothetical protein
LAEFFAYKARRTIHPTKDGRNNKRAAQIAVLLRITDKQHNIPAATAIPRSNVPLRTMRVYQDGGGFQAFSMSDAC